MSCTKKLSLKLRGVILVVICITLIIISPGMNYGAAASITSPGVTLSNDTNSLITRTYKWKCDGWEWSWQFEISKSVYLQYRQKQRMAKENWFVYATEPQNDKYISTLTNKFRTVANQSNLSEWQTINLVVSFVQSIPYVLDEDSTGVKEYPKYPFETLADGGGDCEDKSFLMASLLRNLGYGVVLLDLPGHMAVGVKGSEDFPGSYYTFQGNRYYYLETTSKNWAIGKIPDINKKSAVIYPVIPKPILSTTWQGKGNLYGYNVTMRVKNTGTTTSYGTVVYAAFDAGKGLVYSQKSSQSFDIAPDNEVSLTIPLTMPRKVLTRVIVRVSSQGSILNSSESNWMFTQ